MSTGLREGVQFCSQVVVKVQYTPGIFQFGVVADEDPVAVHVPTAQCGESAQAVRLTVLPHPFNVFGQGRRGVTSVASGSGAGGEGLEVFHFVYPLLSLLHLLYQIKPDLSRVFATNLPDFTLKFPVEE